MKRIADNRDLGRIGCQEPSVRQRKDDGDDVVNETIKRNNFSV